MNMGGRDDYLRTKCSDAHPCVYALPAYDKRGWGTTGRIVTDTKCWLTR